MRNVGEHISFLKRPEVKRRHNLAEPGTYIRFVRIHVIEAAPALLPVAIM